MKHRKLELSVGKLLAKKKLTLAVAESVTGGLISDKITNVSGSSRYFLMGVIAYSNKSKEKLLGVSRKTLQKYGAVSKEIALSMACGVKRRAGSHIGLSTTGVAGPKGETRKKPVGLVYIGIDVGWIKLVKKVNFKGKREFIKRKAAESSLKLLIKLIA